MTYESDPHSTSLMIRATPEKQVTRPITLRDFITRVLITQGEFRLQEMPRQIDLGEFDQMVNRLMTLSEDDPEKSEYGTALLVNTNTHEFSFTNTVRGEESSVHQTLDFLSPQELAADIHSHGRYDLPFTGTDLINLFPSRGTPLPAPVMILVTPTRKMLIARTEETLGQNLEGVSHLDKYTDRPNERMFSLTRVSQKYGLRIYSAPRNKKILSLTS